MVELFSVLDIIIIKRKKKEIEKDVCCLIVNDRRKKKREREKKKWLMRQAMCVVFRSFNIVELVILFYIIISDEISTFQHFHKCRKLIFFSFSQSNFNRNNRNKNILINKKKKKELTNDNWHLCVDSIDHIDIWWESKK